MYSMICALLLSWTAAGYAKPIPPDPALEVSASISGRFINLMTAETRQVTLQPELFWFTADELPTDADALRPFLMTQIDGTRHTIFSQRPLIWEKWKHRTAQSLSAPDGWEMWEASSEPLALTVSVRDKRRRLRSVRVVTADEEQVVSADRKGVAQAECRISPSDSAALVLQGQKSALMVVLLRWTPLVWTERTGIVMTCPALHPVQIDCEECRRGEAAVKQARPDLPPPEAGFQRVYRHVELNKEYPSSVPHFDRTDSVSSSGYLPTWARFARAVPAVSEEEAFRMVQKEVKQWVPPPALPFVQRNNVALSSGWYVWDVQPRGYVVAVWEVQIRPDLPALRAASPLGAARLWSREKAETLRMELPLTPPQDVATALVQRLRSEAAQNHVALKPVATLWFEANIAKPSVFVRDLPPAGSFEAKQREAQLQWDKIWRSGRASLLVEWFSEDAIGQNILYGWRDTRLSDRAGRVRVKWLRWTDTRRTDVPSETEWVRSMNESPLLFYDAEYDISLEPPEGFKTVPSFQLRLSAVGTPRISGEPPPPPISLWSSDPRARLKNHDRSGTVQIPLEPDGLYRLRVIPDSVPQNGQLTITLEGNDNRWEKQIHVGNSQWVWLRRPGIYETLFQFNRLKPGQYTLCVGGEIAWRGDDQQTVKRKVQWQKTLEAKSSWQETVIVPLPR